jgi:hypothetical protein
MARCSAREGGRGVRVHEGRDRGVRGSITSAPWEEHAHDRTLQACSPGVRVRRRSAEAISGVVKRPDPRSCSTEP